MPKDTKETKETKEPKELTERRVREIVKEELAKAKVIAGRIHIPAK